MSEHFNKLTPAEQERLAMLAEEAAEIIQVVGKIIRHGYNSHHPNGGPNNRGLLNGELTDFASIHTAMVDAGDLPPRPGPLTLAARWGQKLRYMHHQDPDHV